MLDCGTEKTLAGQNANLRLRCDCFKTFMHAVYDTYNNLTQLYYNLQIWLMLTFTPADYSTK